MQPLRADPSAHAGQQVTLIGTAQDARAGAMVFLSDDTPVYLAGVEAWDKAWVGKEVAVTGTLRIRQLGPRTNAKGEATHGIAGGQLLLDGATWVAAP